MSKRNKGLLYALVSTIFGSTGTVFATYASKVIDPIAVSGIGQLISGILITSYLGIKRKLNVIITVWT